MQSVLQRSAQWAAHPVFWWVIVVGGLSLEAIALFYQHYLEYPPCVYCIHIRLWIMAVVVLSAVVALLGPGRWLALLGQLSNSVFAGVLVERSYQTLSVERGWSFGACSMESGIPGWMPLDKWIPYVFEVQMPCGYTPKIVANITMAEMLITGGVIFLLVSLWALLALMIKGKSI